jgi:hypothetical protein
MYTLNKCYIKSILLIICTIGLGTAGVVQFANHERRLSRVAEIEQLRAVFKAAEQISDPREAIDAYPSSGEAHREIRFAVLRRQWDLAVDRLHRVRKSRDNRHLLSGVTDQFDELTLFLRHLIQECSQLIETLELADEEVLWQSYNLRGAVRLLEAYCVLENEGNSKKAATRIQEAIADFKAAIQIVDRAPLDVDQRNVPRWNLEVLHGEELLKTIAFSRPESERSLNIRENLEAILPEKGGYAPGEPLDWRIEK